MGVSDSSLMAHVKSISIELLIWIQVEKNEEGNEEKKVIILTWIELKPDFVEMTFLWPSESRELTTSLCFRLPHPKIGRKEEILTSFDLKSTLKEMIQKSIPDFLHFSFSRSGNS